MKLFQNIRKIAKFRYFLISALVGAIFTVLGVIGAFAPKGEQISVDAIIERIETQGAGEDEQYVLYIRYTDIKGETHDNIEYNGYTTGMKEGDTVTVTYDADSPECVSSPGGEWIPYLFVVIGIVSLVSGIFGMKKSVKGEDTATDELWDTEETVVPTEQSNEPTSEYYFHFTGKLNQSYVMETPQRNAVCKATCDKIGVLKPYEYTFENCETGRKFNATVTHTVTKRFGTGNISAVDSSQFKINGENNWDYLKRMGYSVKLSIDGIKIKFDVLRNGTKVADATAGGVNLLNDDKQYKLGDALTTNGIFKVNCRRSDFDGVFMACFCVSRIELF